MSLFSVYFLTGCRMSSTFPMSPFFASRSPVSQPPSLEKPMLVMAWSATWILGSGWVTWGGVTWAAYTAGAEAVSALGRSG